MSPTEASELPSGRHGGLLWRALPQERLRNLRWYAVARVLCGYDRAHSSNRELGEKLHRHGHQLTSKRYFKASSDLHSTLQGVHMMHSPPTVR